MSSFLNILTSVIRVKILAVLIGPSGLGILSVLVNLSALISSVFPIGNVGLTTYISKLKDENKGKVAYLLKFFLKLNIIFIFIFIILLLPFSSSIGHWLFNDDNFQLYIILFLFSVPFSLLYSFVDLYLRGIRAINVFVSISSIGSILGLIVFVPLVYFWGLDGAIVSIVVSSIMNSLLGIFILKKSKLLPDFKLTENTSKKVKTDIIKVGISSAVILVLQNVVYLFIRTKILSTLGEEQVGLYQSVYAVSNSYFAIFFSLMGIYSIPRISELKDNLSKINEINTTLKFMLLLYTPMILIFYVFRFQIIPLFYSITFLSAESLLFYQLLGDFFKVLSWVLGLWLLPSLRIKEWFIFDFIFYIIFSTAFYSLITFYRPDILFASIAYLIAYFIHFVINLVYIVVKLRFSFSASSIKSLILSSLAIVICFFASLLYYDISVYIFLLVFAVWSVFILDKRDYKSFSTIIKNRFMLK